jgi:DeoR/GlpR family transcriptional regulator of sugar metabolism
MLAEQRQAHILELVKRSGAVRVSDLVVDLGVSDMTIRRDLGVLAQAGLVQKVHGGATLVADSSAYEPSFTAKSSLERIAKREIALAAAELVPPGTAVAMSAGTTTHALAGELLDVPGLTVVTNSVHISDLLYQHGRSDQTVLLTGGVRTPSDAFVGPIAVNALTSIHVDLVFMGVHGMTEQTGFTTPNLQEAETNRALVDAGRRLVVVADHTKWGVVGISSIARLDEADTLITDSALDPVALAALEAAVGELIVADHRPLDRTTV